MNKNNKLPSDGWYILVGIIFFASIVGCITLIITTFISSVSALNSGTKFVVPGELILEVKEPTKYTLWNEVSTSYNNQRYSSSPKLPEDLEIEIYQLSKGLRLNFNPSLEYKETCGSDLRYSIGYIYFDKPGEYKIKVSGNFKQRIFLLRLPVLPDILKTAAICVLIGILGLLGGPGLAIFIFIKKSNMKAAQQLSVIKEATKQPGQSLEQKDEHSNIIASEQEKTWAMLCHIGTLLGGFIPFANIIVPLVIWLVKKEGSPFIDYHGKESLNFQLSMTIYYLISAILVFIIIGIFLLIGLGVFSLVIVIIATVKTGDGERYRYPLTIRFLHE